LLLKSRVDVAHAARSKLGTIALDINPDRFFGGTEVIGETLQLLLEESAHHIIERKHDVSIWKADAREMGRNRLLC
jgi:hypothetical protein